MNETAKWMMAGTFLLSFHIDSTGIPIVLGIVSCLVFRSGFRMLKRKGDGEGFEWSHKMEQTGKLRLGITILDLILTVLMRQSTGISIQTTAVLMLAETACGCSMSNHYGELGRRYTQNRRKGPFSLGYLMWTAAGLASHGYSVVLGSGGWNVVGAVCIITGCIMLVKELAVWAPGEKTEYWQDDGQGGRLYSPLPLIKPLGGVIMSLFE